MATWFKALSNIEHGEMVNDDEGVGNKVWSFPHGTRVEGLSAEVMEKLWDAGVLEKVEDVDPPKASVTITRPPAAPVTDPTVDPNAAGDPTDGIVTA